MYKFILIISTLFLSACCTIKDTKRIEKPSESTRIEFGSGGGFAGALNQFAVLPNGEFHAVQGTKSKHFKFDDQVCASKAKKLYKKCIKIDFDTLDFNHPGNMYYFIKYFDKGEVKVIKWGDVNFPVNEDIKDLYKQLTKLIIKKTPNKPSK